MIQVAVIGGGEADEEVLALAREVGREIARAGCVLICGGLGGVMEASARGAKEEGGLTVAILPGASKEEANPHMDLRIVTAMSHARNAIIARSADFLVAVGGEMGTLSEIALGLKEGKPVIVLECRSGIIQALRKLERDNLHFAGTPAEAVKRGLEIIKTYI
jgi:hypothetical protein